MPIMGDKAVKAGKHMKLEKSRGGKPEKSRGGKREKTKDKKSKKRRSHEKRLYYIASGKFKRFEPIDTEVGSGVRFVEGLERANKVADALYGNEATIVKCSVKTGKMKQLGTLDLVRGSKKAWQKEKMNSVRYKFQCDLGEMCMVVVANPGRAKKQSFVRSPNISPSPIPEPKLPLTPMVPQIDTPMVPKIETPMVPKIETPMVPKIETPMVPKKTPMFPKIDTPMVPKNDTPMVPKNDSTNDKQRAKQGEEALKEALTAKERKEPGEDKDMQERGGSDSESDSNSWNSDPNPSDYFDGGYDIGSNSFSDMDEDMGSDDGSDSAGED